MFLAFSEYTYLWTLTINLTLHQISKTKEKSREKVRNRKRCHPIMQALADLKARARAGTTQNPFIFFTMCHAKIFIFFLFFTLFSGVSNNTKNISPEKNGTKTDTSQGRRSTSVRPIHQLFIDDRVRRFLKIEIQFLACQLSYKTTYNFTRCFSFWKTELKCLSPSSLLKIQVKIPN